MAYDEELAARIRFLVEGEPGLSERKMFGGLAFLVNGHMSVAASGQGGLMLRCNPDDTDDLVEEPHTAPMVMRNREMQGWLRVADAGIAHDDDLQRWVDVGVSYARSLPPKQG
jgi:hypothetical protein